MQCSADRQSDQPPFPHTTLSVERANSSCKSCIRNWRAIKISWCLACDFFGGPKVQEFEQTWSERLGANYTVSVNSATSGLYAACAAAGFGPGDEVIVSPYTMSASAIAPVVNGAIPVFADIDPRNILSFCENYRATHHASYKGHNCRHIFGGPAEMAPIIQLAKKHNLVVIEDCAQAPMGRYNGKNLGLIGDMGVFSLNYHKHIHTGEGGLIVTNQDKYAERLQLVRNHAEAVY